MQRWLLADSFASPSSPSPSLPVSWVRPPKCMLNPTTVRDGPSPCPRVSSPLRPRPIFHKGCPSWSVSSFTLAGIKSTLPPRPTGLRGCALQPPRTVPLPHPADLTVRTPALSSQFPEQAKGHPSVLPQLCSWPVPLTLRLCSRGSLGAAPSPPPHQAPALTVSPMTSFRYLVRHVLAHEV